MKPETWIVIAIVAAVLGLIWRGIVIDRRERRRRDADRLGLGGRGVRR